MLVYIYQTNIHFASYLKLLYNGAHFSNHRIYNPRGNMMHNDNVSPGLRLRTR